MTTLIVVIIYAIAIYILWLVIEKDARVKKASIEIREKHIKALEEANKSLAEQNELLYKILRGEKIEEEEE